MLLETFEPSHEIIYPCPYTENGYNINILIQKGVDSAYVLMYRKTNVMANEIVGFGGLNLISYLSRMN